MTNRPLARFRVNPKKVRVGIRHVPEMKNWRITIQNRWSHENPAPREPVIVYASKATEIPRMILFALVQADALRMPGIDLDMQWAYDHPQGVHVDYVAREKADRDLLHPFIAESTLDEENPPSFS